VYHHAKICIYLIKQSFILPTFLPYDESNESEYFTTKLKPSYTCFRLQCNFENCSNPKTNKPFIYSTPFRLREHYEKFHKTNVKNFLI
jgi:hypothetical protein